ncbi:MAG: DegT/DnrJ/EryC1/StrS family aminotransferase [Flavobacteriaceae bacterium]|nr:DegT/DnrJ/EryC1/StrS family aminotransferase [Flavobacteriaceae bacterium]
MIPVTKTFLPPQEEYQAILQEAWDAGWITNRGTLVKRLEAVLQAYLGIAPPIMTTNGTLPLQIALNLFGKGGEIITTPFSYVATTSSIVWQGCTPVFVDIHPDYFTIDETQIEAAITPKTTAILATHVFGNPCHVDAIEAIAQKHGLKVIYDAAHAFGVQYHGKSLLSYGDVSTCSFHATKLFHTGEGGMMLCPDADTYHQLFYRHNFGHNGALAFHGLGINAKMSELQAAMGLAVLPYVAGLIAARKKVVEVYDAHLDFTRLRRLDLRPGTEWNYSYYPVVFESETALLQAEKALNAQQIFPRRYFYPGLHHLPYVQAQDLPVCDAVYKSVLCLPVYQNLSIEDIKKITETLNLNAIC